MSEADQDLFSRMVVDSLAALGPQAWEDNCDFGAICTTKLRLAKLAATSALPERLKKTKKGRMLIAKALACAFWAWNCDIDADEKKEFNERSHAVFVFVSFARHMAALMR